MEKITIEHSVETLREVLKEEEFPDTIINQLSLLFKEKLEIETSKDPVAVARSILLRNIY